VLNTLIAALSRHIPSSPPGLESTEDMVARTLLAQEDQPASADEVPIPDDSIEHRKQKFKEGCELQ
jgi:hypothetical protein